MFGQKTMPTILDAGLPLLLNLLSPTRRPVQVIHDLASFWQNDYSEAKKDLKGTLSQASLAKRSAATYQVKS